MNNKEKNFASAVIYIHNAEDRAEAFLKAVMNVLETNFEHSEIICVNDYSTDKSLDIVKKVSAQAKSTGVSVVNMSYFHGLEIAMNAGMDLTIGDFVFEFDNTILDFQPDEIMRIYRKSLEGFDIVNASAQRRERSSSRIFYNVFNHFSNNRFDLKTESFRVLSRRVINRISSMNKTVPYRKVVYAEAGLKMETLYYTPTISAVPAEDHKEKSYRMDLAVDSLILFTKVGYKVSVGLTLAMMMLSVLMVIYSVVTYLTANPIAGWTTTVLFLSLAFAGLFGILTIVIKYLQLVINLVFKRKYYSFESIEKLTK